MQQSAGSRKRPAPGASPLIQQQSQQPQLYQAQQQAQAPYATAYPQVTSPPNFTDFDFSQPFNTDQPFDTPLDGNAFAHAFSSGAPQQTQYTGDGLALGHQQGQTQAQAQSTDLVRRPRGGQVVQQQHQQPANGNGALAQQQPEAWPPNTYDPNNMPSNPSPDETEQDLSALISLAKSSASSTGKRKQIPPFVQKLSSFLNTSENTSLIRWADSGRAFIVLDEDEFARTLIPELFKHNNYASFVRQLNMYGFHKTVNITDGSLRQSEKARRGVKPPSMYSHPYFRRNRPDLLWLIQKPGAKTGTGATGAGPGKRKRANGAGADGGGGESDEGSPGPSGIDVKHAVGVTSANGGSGQAVAHPLPRGELATVRTELQKLQTQQRFISKMITQLKEQNDSFYRQATAFQALHDRHENSINAILTFLATFYNRSVEGQGGLGSMFGTAGSGQGGQQQQQQGGVVEEEMEGAQAPEDQRVQRFVRRPQLLLPGPVGGTAFTAPNSTRASLSPPIVSATESAGTQRQSATPGATLEPATTTSSNTETQMLHLLHNLNANNSAGSTPASNLAAGSPAFDFTGALEHYQGGSATPLTPQQRDDVLALMNRTPSVPGETAAPGMPDLQQLRQTQQQLEMLGRAQRVQDERVQELTRRLAPLSPGLGSGGDGGFPFDAAVGAGEYDPNAFLDFGESVGDGTAGFGFDGGGKDGEVDWDFGAGDAVAGGEEGMFGDDVGLFGEDDGGKVESLSSEETSPVAAVKEEEDGTARKRARRT